MNPTKTLTILSLLATLASATTYENANNGTTDKWKVYDNKPAGAIIENVYDKTLNSKVIKLTGEGRKNAYMLGQKSGKKAWNNRSEKNISWKMNFAENFKIMVYVKTKLGQRVLYYDYKNKDRGVYKKKYIRFGLGRASKKGTWLTIQRDLEADLKKYEPNNTIISVNAFRVNGSGMVDDIQLTKTKGTTTKPIMPTTGALKVSNIEGKRLSNTMAQISWDLNHKGTGQVEYGVTQNYGSFSKKDSSFNYDAHSQKLKHLKANTTYHYRVISEDRSGNKIVSNDATFSTKVGNIQTKPNIHPKQVNTNPPITLEKLKAMIKNGEDVTKVNTSEITDMCGLFMNNKTFNQDISGWDVSNVTNMRSMFHNAVNFNQPIGTWNVSKVTNMQKLFFYTTNFNQPINNWNVSNVTNMNSMFFGATHFNQPLNYWDVSSVTNMSSMFIHAKNFNQAIGGWNLSNVTDIGSMFWEAKSFNQDLSKWNISNVKTIYNTEYGEITGFLKNTSLSTNNYEKLLIAWSKLPLHNNLTLKVGNTKYNSNEAAKARQILIKKFKWVILDNGQTTKQKTTNINPPITKKQLKAMIKNNKDVTQVNTSEITDMSKLFEDNEEFNQDISGWDVSNVTDMSGLFKGNDKFNQNISGWDVSNVTTMKEMFNGAENFNQPIGNWDVSKVTDMSFIFGTYYASSVKFNQDISTWDVSNVTKMEGMFYGADNFNQDINSWNVSNVKTMDSMFEGARKFNQPLDNWDVSNVTNMESMFHSAHSFNQSLEKWNVSNVTNMHLMFCNTKKFNHPLEKWDVSSVTNMSAMFLRSNFNQPIGNWNLSNVTDISSIFSGTTTFNQDISNWNVSNVTNMSFLFHNNKKFNQDISNWDVSKVTDMHGMFEDATNFNQPLEKWNVSNVTNMESMFSGASSFNQALNKWNITNVTNMESMFSNAINFNHPLERWKLSNKTDIESILHNTKLYFKKKFIFSNITEKDFSANSYTLSWNLNRQGTAQIEYGTTKAYGSFSKKETRLDTEHYQILEKLKPNTTYYYRILTDDKHGNKGVSKEQTFHTDISVNSITKGDIFPIKNIEKLSKNKLNLGEGASVKKSCIFDNPSDNGDNDATCSMVYTNTKGKEERLQSIRVMDGSDVTGTWIKDFYDDADDITYSFYRDDNLLYLLNSYYFVGYTAETETDPDDYTSSGVNVTIYDISDKSKIRKIYNATPFGKHIYVSKDFIFIEINNYDTLLIVNKNKVINNNKEIRQKFTMPNYNTKKVHAKGQYLVLGNKNLLKLSKEALKYVAPNNSSNIYVLEKGNQVEVISKKSSNDKNYFSKHIIDLNFKATKIAAIDNKILVYNDTQA